MRSLPALVALAIPYLPSAAQTTPPPPTYRVVEWRTAPGDAAAFRTGMGDLARLSRDTRSPLGFRVYSAESRTVVTREARTDDLLGNPLQHMLNARPGDVQKWIAGRPAAEQLRNEIWVAVPDWSYAPATVPAVTGISVATVKIPPGKAAAFDTVRKDFVKFRQKVGYPYPVRAFRVVLGEPRIVFVTSFDSRSAFFGANAFNALVEKAGAQSEWQALVARLSGTMAAEWDTKLWNYNEAVSYIPQP